MVTCFQSSFKEMDGFLGLSHHQLPCLASPGGPVFRKNREEGEAPARVGRSKWCGRGESWDHLNLGFCLPTCGGGSCPGNTKGVPALGAFPSVFFLAYGACRNQLCQQPRGRSRVLMVVLSTQPYEGRGEGGRALCWLGSGPGTRCICLWGSERLSIGQEGTSKPISLTFSSW